MNKGTTEVANLFGVSDAIGGNVADELWPGSSGLVVAGTALRSMTWGFPRHAISERTGKALKPKPVNNARDDRLRSLPMWRDAFRERRCLIPVASWCEPEGSKRQKTRTWFSIPNEEVFAVAGIWTQTEEWGDAYSMVMVDSCQAMSEVHDRMPVILQRDDWDRWTDGTQDQASQLLKAWGGPLRIERTDRPWRAHAITSKLKQTSLF